MDEICALLCHYATTRCVMTQMSANPIVQKAGDICYTCNVFALMTYNSKTVSVLYSNIKLRISFVVSTSKILCSFLISFCPRPTVSIFSSILLNLLTPNDDYSGRTAPLTSKCCILYIYSTNIGTE